ncbi:MAG: hypothetical protein A2X49_12835 [Lentisphaerae bacterium GWF2_52_8]|nr:MAG: hypothetical protein A2X49_12835 [Lentisphaerae bacterium GWF2_52_8]
MKKLLIVCTLTAGMAFGLYAADANTESVAATNDGNAVSKKHEKCSPEEILAQIEERTKKLEARKAKAESAGKTDVANAVQAVIDALNKMKAAISSKDKESIKAAHEQLKSARSTLRALCPKKGEKKGEKKETT